MNYAAVPAVEDRPSTWALLHKVYCIYRDHHIKFATITIPAALFASFAITLSRLEGRYLSSKLTWNVEILQHPWELAQIFGVATLGFFLVWFFGCFAFAATASTVQSLAPESIENLDISDGYSRARDCVRPIFVFAVLTFLMLGAAYYLSIWLAPRVAGKMPSAQTGHAAFFVVIYGTCLLAIAFVTRYSLAIPKIVDRGGSAWRAMLSTAPMTDGYDGYLLLLVAESVLGTYLAQIVVFLTVQKVLQRTGMIDTAWSGWILILAVALGSALVQPPMFIGFSLLYLEQTREHHALPNASASLKPTEEQMRNR